MSVPTQAELPAWEQTLRVTTADQTHALGAALGAVLQAGDLLVLTGELGAGKTTFTQGLGEGLGVRAGIISPTFVLVRIHPNLPDGPAPAARTWCTWTPTGWDRRRKLTTSTWRTRWTRP